MSETSTFRILLIAEDPLIGSILRDQLQSLSHSVSLHASAGEGLADAQQQSFPLVIVDDQHPSLSYQPNEGSLIPF